MIICAVASQTEVYIGSDSIVLPHITPSVIAPSLSVYRRTGYVIGVCAMPYIVHHIRASFIPPKRNDKLTLETHMATTFYREFMSSLTPYRENIQALIGSMGKLFYFSHYGVVECVDGYMAIGDAADIALGSLYSTMNMAGYKRIAVALSAATKHNHLIRAPYTILSSGLYAVSRYSPDFHSNMTEVDLTAQKQEQRENARRYSRKEN